MDTTSEPARSPRRLDVIVVTDLRFPGGTSSSLAEELEAAAAGGYHVGVAHITNPRLGQTPPVHPRLRQLFEQGATQFLAPGEPAAAPLAIVKHPMVFLPPLEGRLPLDVDTVVMTTGQVPADEAGTYYDPVVVDANVREAFAVTPRWAPVSPVVRATLHGVQLASEDWVEVIDPTSWQRNDKPPGPQLVIGRHSRPDSFKWPSDPNELRAAYPIDGSVRVRILGGADAPGEALGEIPPSWEVMPFGAVEPGEFLAGLDAFVYFHHPDLTEAFGRNILEAVAAGVPAVVPPHFESLFGDACLYATPATAIDVVGKLCADADARRAHITRASAVVEERFSHGAHRARLAQLVGPPSASRPQPAPAAPPSIERIPPGERRTATTTLVAALNATEDDVDRLLRSVDAHRRQAPGFVPIVVVTVRRPELAAELGIEIVTIKSRRWWPDDEEPWADYALRRLRQVHSRYGVDNLTVADPTDADAWIAMQLKPPRPRQQPTT